MIHCWEFVAVSRAQCVVPPVPAPGPAAAPKLKPCLAAVTRVI